jgi:CheY-like chemotaxis protein
MAVRAQILVVDDDHGFGASARAMLERDGFTVAEAATSAAPAEAARAVQPPDSDGFEVAGRLADQGDAPVIVLTPTRKASDYGEPIAASPVAGFAPKNQLSEGGLRGFPDKSPPRPAGCGQPGPGRGRGGAHGVFRCRSERRFPRGLGLATTDPGVPGPPDPDCAAWPTASGRQAACCASTARRVRGPPGSVPTVQITQPPAPLHVTLAEDAHGFPVTVPSTGHQVQVRLDRTAPPGSIPACSPSCVIPEETR